MAEAVRHDKTARQLRMLSDALDSGRLGPVRRLVNTLAPAEIGNLLESLPPGKREVVWGLVDPEDDGEVLVDLLRERGVTELDVVGIATDHCVRASALDALSAGVHVRVLTDLIAGVAPAPSAAALAELRERGAEEAEAGRIAS